jgi:poly(3-hydroxybutyrate) depolymerase
MYPRFSHTSRVARHLIGALALGACFGSAMAADRLPALEADPSNVTVSGLSSGAFMAVQFHVAHSSIVRGAGVLAGGPYYCAQQGGVLFAVACMQPKPGWPIPAPEKRIHEVVDQARKGNIDGPQNLRTSRVWLLSGGKDSVVFTDVVNATSDFYQAVGVPASNILFERVRDSEHAMLNPDAKDAKACSFKGSPYLNKCGSFDAPGRLFAHLLKNKGKLKPAAKTDDGEFLTFDQSEFTDEHSVMDSEAFVYIPKGCRDDDAKCGVHIAFHGCGQQKEELGELYAREAGYNRWAESNKLIVLYPQAVKDYSLTLEGPKNPNGCWDWWGYTSVQGYHLQSALQISAVKAMLDRLIENK